MYRKTLYGVSNRISKGKGAGHESAWTLIMPKRRIRIKANTKIFVFIFYVSLIWLDAIITNIPNNIHCLPF